MSYLTASHSRLLCRINLYVTLINIIVVISQHACEIFRQLYTSTNAERAKASAHLECCAG